MQPARVLISVAVAIPLMLAACAGGSDSQTATARRLDELRSDPRVVRLEGILERADTLVIPNLYLRYSFSSQGVTLTDELVVGFACSGVRCVAEDDGTEVTIADLVDPSSAIASTDFELGSRGGFDTATLRGVFEVEESIPEVTLTASPTINSYGFWGEYGFAAIDIVDATMSGLTDGTEISGSMGFAGAYVIGDTSGSNPGGTGSATWTGIAEATSTATSERHQGTATVTIADLSQPRVGVDIAIPGHDIRGQGWEAMALANGRYVSEAEGAYLEGHFLGPDHSETFGVFDTGRYVGVFGAQQAP